MTNIIVDQVFHKYHQEIQQQVVEDGDDQQEQNHILLINKIKNEIRPLLHQLQNSAYADGTKTTQDVNLYKKPVYL